MRFILPLLTYLFLSVFTNFNFWSEAAICIWVFFLVHFFAGLNHSIAFREYIVMMYGLNYLFSPAITYEITQEIAIYKMKLTPAEYFQLAIPSILLLYAGLMAIKTKIFTYQFHLGALQTSLNATLCKRWFLFGMLFSFSNPFFPGDIGFIVYLLSGIKYIGAFGLFIIDKRKYKWYLFAILFVELTKALREGMFHDLVIWCLFFGMVWIYLKKPGTAVKTGLICAGVFVLFLLQTVKATYRDQIKAGEAGFDSFSSAVSKNTEGEGLFSLANIALSVTRANQGWILASTVNKMNYVKNFQEMELVKIYAEAALLPRALAPNKLNAGDITIFNQFSGAKLTKGTSMGLGLLADGYISYGAWGTYIFSFVFGLLCAAVFKLIERWTDISPIFALFSFPLLNYAVRADCETQTWMGHIVKGVIVFSILMHFTRQYFKRNTLPDSDSNTTELSAKPQLAPQIV